MEYNYSMDNWASRLQNAFDKTGWTKMELHRRSGVPYASVNKYLDGAVDQPRGNTLLLLANALKVDALWLETGIVGTKEVPLKGYVGAGQAVFPIDDGGDDTVPAPAGVQDGTVAVKIQGDSMFPAYEDGTILYYSKNLPPKEMVNRRCVVRLEDGSMFVKVLRSGSQEGLWTLQSINISIPDMVDQVVDWASPIEWTKPSY